MSPGSKHDAACLQRRASAPFLCTCQMTDLEVENATSARYVRETTRWNCGRCGYLALSSPHEDSEKGTEVHKCPKCGEQWWLDEHTYHRMRAA